MKSLIVYYSHSGNTALVAYKFLNALNKKGKTEIFSLSYKRRSRNLLLQFLYRIIPVELDIGNAPFDVKGYDVLCLGIPVWGGRPAPPLSAYIKACQNTDGKKVICFQIYGIETSAERCLDYVRGILNTKGHSEIINVGISWHKVHDEEFVDKCIQETLDKL